MDEVLKREDLEVGYWRCPACGHLNRPESIECVFRCVMNEETIIRPQQLNG